MNTTETENDVNRSKEHAHKAVTAVADAGRAGVEAAREKVMQGKQVAADYAQQATEKAKDYAHQANEKAHEYAGRAKSQADEFVEMLQQHIEKHPLQAIAVAAGVGVLVGTLMRRR
jgi:ElaB/YqjD/DUF883 family membrane-anchored ribosome-binding protein